MAWTCMAASGMVSLIFIDDITQDSSSRMNSDVYRIILSANLQITNNLLQQNNDPKHTANTTNDFIKGKKLTALTA